MNILFLTTHVNAGGITTYLLTLSQGLIQSGHRVFIISSGGDAEKRFKILGVFTYLLDIKTKSELNPKIYFSLPAIKKLIVEQKITLIHTQTRVTQVMGCLLEWMTGIPHVTTCHGFFRLRFSRRLFPCWGKASIAISPAVREHLLRDFHRREKDTPLIPHGVDAAYFTPPSEREKCEMKKGLNFPFSAPVVGMLGRLSDVKGHAILIKAWPDVLKEFPAARLAIVGKGREEQNLKKLVRETRTEASVAFIEAVHHSRAYLQAFDIFVMPSLREGLGLSLMEAQAMGLPIVASRVGGIVALLEHGKNGLLVAPGDCRELAAAVCELLREPQKAKHLGQEARAFILREYPLERMVRQTVTVYENVVRECSDEKNTRR